MKLNTVEKKINRFDEISVSGSLSQITNKVTFISHGIDIYRICKDTKLFWNQLTGSDFKLLIQTMIKQSRYGKKYMRLTFIFRHFNTIETNTIFLL